MTIFSPDGKYGYVCSSFTPETDVITVADHQVVARVPQASSFCPYIAATPDGSQVWLTLKDSGKTQVFDARPPFSVLKTLDTGPITNHVNIVHNANGTFAYVTVGGLNEIQVYRTDDFSKVANIPTGKLPHGVWPSGDGARVYVGLENDDRIAAIDTLTNKVIATSPIGQAPQAVVYVPEAVSVASNGANSAMTTMTGARNLQSLGVAGQSAQLWLVPPGRGQLSLQPAFRCPTRASCRCWRPRSLASTPASLTCWRSRQIHLAPASLSRCKDLQRTLPAPPSSIRSGQSVRWCMARTKSRAVTW